MIAYQGTQVNHRKRSRSLIHQRLAAVLLCLTLLPLATARVGATTCIAHPGIISTPGKTTNSGNGVGSTTSGGCALAPLHILSVWAPKQGGSRYVYNYGSDAFATAHEKANDDGLRLEQLEVSIVDGKRYRAAFWSSGTGADYWRIGIDWDDVVEENHRRIDDDLYLVDLDVFWDDDQWLYSGVWRPGSGRQTAVTWYDRSDFLNYNRQYVDDGLRLDDLDASVAGDGRVYYTAVWHRGTGTQEIVTDATWDELLEAHTRNIAHGRRLAGLDVFERDNITHFAAYWREDKGSAFSDPITYSIRWDQFDQTIEDNWDDNRQLIGLSIYRHEES